MSQYAATQLLVALTEEEYKISDQAKSTSLDIYDRFTLEIPYANFYIKVRVMLSAADPLLVPDMIVLYPQLDIDFDYHYLFRDWNPSDRRAFLIVFSRLKAQFTEFYLSIFQILQTPQMAQIYKSCLSLLDGKQMELMLAYNDEEITEAVFALPMPISLAHETCTKPVFCLVSLRAGYDKFFLDIVYPNWASHLHAINIHKLSPSNGLPINKFEELTRQLYTYFLKEINSVCNSKDQRALFFTELNKTKIGLPLEVDTVDFLKMNLHNEIIKGNSVEVINIVVLLEKDFPKTSPTYKIRSMKGIKNGQLREKKYQKVKHWDSDLDISMLAQVFKKSVCDDLAGFVSWLELS